MIKLSDYVADFLLRQGIDTVFMVSGGGAMHLNDSFGKRHHYVPCHHEQACAIAVPITLRQNRRFSYIDVRDLIGLLPKLIEADLMHKSYNVVGNQYVELKELAEFINLNFGEESKVVIAKDGYGLDYYGSNLRLQQEVGFETTPVEQSITRLYNYYLENKEKLNLKELLIDK